MYKEIMYNAPVTLGQVARARERNASREAADGAIEVPGRMRALTTSNRWILR